MDQIEKLREEIDDIDKELVKLFEKRMETVLKIAEWKKNNHVPIFNKLREEQVIEKNTSYLRNPYFKKPTEEYLNHIMEISRKIQNQKLSNPMDTPVSFEKNKLKVGFQGVEGSFSEQALLEYFGEDVIAKNVSEFKDVFESLKNNEIDYGVLPIENSSTGGIAEVYDLLRQYGFYIVGERCVKVEHHLLGVKGTKIEDIIEVYSHPQAFGQSSEFFKMHPDWKQIPYKNTATSAKYIKNENTKTKAAVASKKAAKLYELDVLESNINYNKRNYTRFIIIGKELEKNDAANKISLVVTVAHKAGCLHDILKHFAQEGLNMLKIESRPIIDRSWEYFFYIDFEGNINEKAVKESIQAIEENSSYFKLLGNYKAHQDNWL